MSDNDLKYFYEEFTSKNLEFLNREKLDGYISNEDYLTCNNIWNRFSMKNMGDYHNHYLRKDVLLLAVFEKFIDT